MTSIIFEALLFHWVNKSYWDQSLGVEKMIKIRSGKVKGRTSFDIDHMALIKQMNEHY